MTTPAQSGHTFVVNPVSGGGCGPAAAAPVVDRLRAAGADVEVATSPDVAVTESVVREAVDRGRVVVSVGGDGMLSSMAGLVSDLGGVLGIVPAGRGNDFARMVGITDDPDALAVTLLGGTPTPTDLLALHLDGRRRVVAGSVYSGVDAVASELVDRVRWMPRRLQYPYAAVRSLASYRPLAARVVVDGEAHHFTAATVVVANSAYYGSGMQIAPAARVDDGLLDVVVIEAASRRGLIKSLPKVYDGGHVALDEVHVLQGRSVEIISDTPAPMGGDGEPLGRVPGPSETAARIELLPGSLQLLR